MKADLRLAASIGRIEGVATENLNKLVDLDLCDSDGILNPFGRVIALSLIPLAEQCRALQIPLEIHESSWNGRPEPAALQLIAQEGGLAFSDEGQMLHALIHALLLPRLYAVASNAWNRSCGYDRARSWFYLSYGGYNDLLDVQPDLPADLLEDISRWDKAAFMESWRILRGWGDD